MHDFESFQRALVEHGSQRGALGNGDGEPSYMDSLMNSMSLVLDEFYNHLTVSSDQLSNLGDRELLMRLLNAF